jgi:hypothetical protein
MGGKIKRNKRKNFQAYTINIKKPTAQQKKSP